MRNEEMWQAMHNQGLVFRATEQGGQWEYSIPGVTNDWEGTYVTKEEALVAAVARLILAARDNTGLLDTKATRLDSLKKRLHVLHMERALQGYTDTVALGLEIDQLVKEIRKLEAQNELVGDN